MPPPYARPKSEWRIADDRVHPRKLAAELRRRRLGEEVPRVQGCVEAFGPQQRARMLQRRRVEVDSVQQPARRGRIGTVVGQAPRGGQQEDGLAACRVQPRASGRPPVAHAARKSAIGAGVKNAPRCLRTAGVSPGRGVACTGWRS